MQFQSAVLTCRVLVCFRFSFCCRTCICSELSLVCVLLQWFCIKTAGVSGNCIFHLLCSASRELMRLIVVHEGYRNEAYVAMMPWLQYNAGTVQGVTKAQAGGRSCCSKAVALQYFINQASVSGCFWLGKKKKAYINNLKPALSPCSQQQPRRCWRVHKEYVTCILC